jgi:hypothetical protein
MARTWCNTLLMLIALIVATPANTQTLREEVPITYTVKPGDTLWGISAMYLEEPWRWPELWEINPSINNPHLIYPGDVLHLSWENGQPRLRVQRGSGDRTVKLSPQMRAQPLNLAIPTIPLDQIAPFLRRHRVISPLELRAAPYVVAGTDERLISGAGDTLYGRGAFKAGETTFGIFRQNDIYRDPLTQEFLGYQGQAIGTAQLRGRHPAEVAELEISAVYEEVRLGDRFFAAEDRVIQSNYQPRAPSVPVDGLMIAIDGGVTQIGAWDIVVINRGLREGLEIGDVLAIYQAGGQTFDQVRKQNIPLPDVRAGLLMVFETFEKVSYGIVLRSSKPLAIMDKVRNP